MQIYTHRTAILHAPSPPPTPDSPHCSYEFGHLSISCQWNHAGFVLLGLPYFTYHHVLRAPHDTFLRLVTPLPFRGRSQKKECLYEINRSFTRRRRECERQGQKERLILQETGIVRPLATIFIIADSWKQSERPPGARHGDEGFGHIVTFIQAAPR